MRRYKIVALVVSVVVLTLVGVGAQMIVGGDIGHITGVVTLVNGSPLARVEVTLSRGGGILRTTTTNAKGEFGFLVLDPDRYEVTATAPGYRPTTVWATVTKGSTVELSLMIGNTRPGETLADVMPPPPPALLGYRPRSADDVTARLMIRSAAASGATSTQFLQRVKNQR
jgi:carboxypeptidase family protein